MRKGRPKISGQDSLSAVIVKMAEGNPGALDVCMRMTARDPAGLFVLLSLDDMNIRGEQIWIAYKDFAKEDISLLIESANSRNHTLVTVVNANSTHPSGPAVKSGASYW